MFIPEMLLTAKVMKTGLEVLKQLLTQGNVKPRGTVIIGTVKGGLHDIGKNLVGMMVEGSGFHVIDLGVDVGHEPSFLLPRKTGRSSLPCRPFLPQPCPPWQR